MSILVNKVKIEGNSIFIRSNPTTGILALAAFVYEHDGSGESSSSSFTRTFRYSTNGITFSDWIALNGGNIQSIQVQQKDTLIIELQYYRNQPPGSDLLHISEVEIGTASESPILPGYYFKHSIFYNFFGTEDVEVLNWYINVLDKLYQRGLLPNYIDRLNDFGKPDDFIEFWKGICKYFSYYVAFARKFQKFYVSEGLLTEYLDERGIRTSPEDNLGDLQYLMQNFYHEISNRGTIHIVDRGAPIHGEILRLIHNKSIDEFIFNPNLPQHSGWNIGNSSPLYRGMTIHDNANKFFEPGIEPSDISLYPTTGAVSVITDSSIGKKVISMTNGGIRDINGSKVIKVDEFMDYELSFYIKKADGNNLTVGLDAFQADGNSDISLRRYKDNSNYNFFFENKNLQRSDKYLFIRLFLYNKHKPIFAGATTHLKLSTGVLSVVPKILINGATAKVYNLRFVPMRTNYSKGLMQVNNFIDCWLRNNNNELSIEQVTRYIKHYLIPYSSHIEVNKTTQVGDYSKEEVGDTKYWVGGGQYCQRTIWIPSDPSCEINNLAWVAEEETAYCET